MKKIVAISLSIFLIAVLAIIVFGLLPRQNEKSESAATPISQKQTTTENNTPDSQQFQQTPQPNTDEKQNTPSATIFSLSEVAKHNNASDCWLIINGKIYDVSKYLEFGLHPGASDTITPYCGKEATNAFETKDKKKPKSHSGKAWDMLNDYYVGDLTQ